MGILILLGACIYPAPTSAIATFIGWLVCKICRKARKPNYSRVLSDFLVGVFLAFLIPSAMTYDGHFIPR
jgi:hypothetical protein